MPSIKGGVSYANSQFVAEVKSRWWLPVWQKDVEAVLA
jgi:hypothetical protein